MQSNPAPGRGSQQPRREIHIQIRYEGDGLPPTSELDKRDALEDALRAENVGEVVDAGGGMGVMDIYLAVDDVAIAMSDAKAIVKRLGLEARTTVEPVPASPGQ